MLGVEEQCGKPPCPSTDISTTDIMTKRSKAKKQNASQSKAIAQISGQGGYYTDKFLPFVRQIVPDGTFAKAGRTAGGLLGSAYGPSGGIVGSELGSMAGNALRKITGFGDYSVSQNTLSQVGKAIQPGEAVPSFMTTGGVTRLCHREYIGDVLVPATPTAFSVTTYTINPGDSITFPWLAAVASAYQQYHFNGLVFEFKSLTSEVATGGPMGSVILGTNYDVIDVAWGSKIQMENAQYTVSAKPSWTQIHTVECAPDETANKLYYVRTPFSSSTASQDARFFDLGAFQLATTGLAGTAGQVLGELWASYDISLYKPELTNASSASQKIVSAGSVSRTSVFGVSPTLTGANCFSCINNTMTCVVGGQYILAYFLDGTVFVAPTFSGTATTTMLSTTAPLPGTVTRFLQIGSISATAGQTVIVDASASTTVTAGTWRLGSYLTSLS